MHVRQTDSGQNAPDHACRGGDAQSTAKVEGLKAWVNQQKSEMPQEEHEAFDRFIKNLLLARGEPEAKDRQAAEDAARLTDSGQNAPEDQDAGQHMNEDPDSVEPESVSRTSKFHYPWKFVSAQLTNRKGDEILYPINDDRDRLWARRLEWAIDKHRDIAEDDLDELQRDYEKVLRRSKEAHERRYDQWHIAELYQRLELANKRFRTLGFCTSIV